MGYISNRGHKLDDEPRSYKFLNKILNKLNTQPFQPNMRNIFLLIHLHPITTKHTSNSFIGFYIHLVVYFRGLLF